MGVLEHHKKSGFFFVSLENEVTILMTQKWKPQNKRERERVGKKLNIICKSWSSIKKGKPRFFITLVRTEIILD